MSHAVKKKRIRDYRAEGLQKAVKAYEIRIAVLEALAPDRRCAHCRTRKRDLADLEVDHVDGRDYTLSSLSSLARARRYAAELASGVRLRALCRSCNARLW
jgi:hypothetical protein